MKKIEYTEDLIELLEKSPLLEILYYDIHIVSGNVKFTRQLESKFTPRVYHIEVCKLDQKNLIEGLSQFQKRINKILNNEDEEIDSEELRNEHFQSFAFWYEEIENAGEPLEYWFNKISFNSRTIVTANESVINLIESKHCSFSDLEEIKDEIEEIYEDVMNHWKYGFNIMGGNYAIDIPNLTSKKFK